MSLLSQNLRLICNLISYVNIYIVMFSSPFFRAFFLKIFLVTFFFIKRHKARPIIVEVKIYWGISERTCFNTFKIIEWSRWNLTINENAGLPIQEKYYFSKKIFISLFFIRFACNTRMKVYANLDLRFIYEKFL